jgi:hypothetical protein
MPGQSFSSAMGVFALMTHPKRYIEDPERRI